MRINRKGLENSYLSKHLLGKGISLDMISRCLAEGQEVTDELGHTKPGSRYFRLDLPSGAGLPGRFVLPDLDGPLGGLVANWNAPCVFKFRHGKLAPIIRRGQLPEWLVDYASALYVIIERNQLPDGRLQLADGPSEEDPEGSWIVATVHFGPPSRQKPRVPRDCSDPKAVKQYLEDLDSFDREQSRVVFVDLEADGQVGPAPEPEDPGDELGELRRLVSHLKGEVDSLRKQVAKAQAAARRK